MRINDLHIKYEKVSTSSQQFTSPKKVWRVAQIGQWYLDVTTLTAYYDDEWESIHELHPHFTLNDYIHLLQGQSKEQFEQALQTMLNQAQPFDLELEIVTSTNTQKWIRMIGVPIIKHEQLIGIEGIVQLLTSERLEYKKNIIETLFDLIPDSYFVIDIDGYVRDFRMKESLAINIPPNLLLHKHITEFIPADIAAQTFTQMDVVMQQQEKVRFTFQISGENHILQYECQLSLLTNGKQFMAVVRDVTEQYEAQQAIVASEQRYELLIQNAPFPILVVRLSDRHFIYANTRARAHFGLYENDIIGLHVAPFYLHAEDREKFNALLAKDGVITDFEMAVQDYTGKQYWALFSAAIVQFNNEAAILISINDITVRKQAEEALRLSEENYRQLALFDELTGAPNKNNFKIASESLLANMSHSYAFVILDINHLKLVNDLFGFEKGDALLQYIANTLSDQLEEDEIFARAEADKFYLQLKFHSIEQLEHRIQTIFEKIDHYEIQVDANYHLIVNAGIYIMNEIEANLSINHIIDRASLALRKTKESHGNAYYFYNDTIRNNLIMQREIENRMYTALYNKEFKVYVQPKYCMKTNQIIGGEALIRWQHPTKGIIPPIEFIPVFEQNGFITKLDMYVVETICQKQQQWIAQGRTPHVIAINQSKLHFFNIRYIEELQSILNKYQIEPNLIELEFTESAVFDNIDALLNVISELRQLGFKMSIDDFGTGYSSLNMLKDVVVDTLKLDRGFLIDTTNEQRRKLIIQAIIGMAKTLSMSVVAEGIETTEQEDLLKSMGCDIGQGYFFAKPMPIEEFYDLLLDV